MTDEAATGRRVLRTWGVVAGLAVAAALAAFVAWLVPRWNDTGMTGVDREVERLRAAGYATTREEWDADLDPAAAARAAELDAADAWLLERFGDRDRWMVSGLWQKHGQERWWERLTDSERDSLSGFLRELAPYFDRVDAATRSGVARWAMRPYAEGANGDSPVSALQRLQVLHETRARVAADPEQQLAALVPLFRTGADDAASGVIEGMVRCAIHGSAARTLRDVVMAGDLPAAQARASLEPLLRVEHLGRMKRLAGAEIVFTSLLIRAVEAGRHGPPPGSIGSVTARVGQLLVGSPAHALRTLREIAELDSVDAASRLAAVRRIDSEASGSATTVACMWPGIVSRLTRTDAALRLARVALAAKERHETTGAWPPSLDALGEDFPDGIPVDPYTGRPFRYDVGDAVVRISSAAAFPGDPPADGEVAATLTWTFQR